MPDISKYNENELQSFIRNDDAYSGNAFEYFFDKYSPKLNSYCRFRCKSIEDAEEIFTDVWMKFLEYVRSGKQIVAISPYLHLVAKNLIIDKYRKDNANKTTKMTFNEDLIIDNNHISFNLDEFMEKEEMITLIKLASDTLEEKYRDPFIMFWFGGLSHNEISEIINESRDNTKIICYRAMQKVIKFLQPYIHEFKS